MNITSLLAIVAVVFALAFAAMLVLLLAEKRRSAGLAIDLARLGTPDDARARALDQANAVAELMLKRAEDSFRQRDEHARTTLALQLQPVAETLAKVQEQVAAVEKVRAEETGGLKQQIENVMRAAAETQAEARKLSSALKRGAGVQGRWGEQVLLNTLEMAGLRRGIDFEEQVSVNTEEGRLRPDFTLRLPGGGVFVIDSKVSLTAFQEAQDAADETARELAVTRHVQSLRGHIQGLSAKAYWDQFASSPDFVAMFVPGDGILALALDRQPNLIGEALDKRVIVVTPTSLFALCKAVAYGWRAEGQAANARAIADAGRELHDRVSKIASYAIDLGGALDKAVERYNQFAGSLERNVLTSAKRLEQLSAAHPDKTLPEMRVLDGRTRPLSKLAPPTDEAGPPPS
jgi:DNA recombination protein RmuC